MLKLLPLILLIGYTALSLVFSMWRTRAMLAQQSKPLTDPAILRLADRLADGLDVPQIKVSVFEVPVVNGLAAADGQIYLTRGFLNARARGEVTAEELASVIAHELGHVALGHMRRRMIDFTGQNAVVLTLSALVNRFLPGLGPMLIRTISAALMARLSQRDEFEADAYASALLIKAGIGTGPQITLFEKLGHLTGQNGATAPAWLLSHPRTEARIAAIRANTARWQSGVSGA